MTTYVAIIGATSPLPQAAFNPVPIIGATPHTPPFVSPLPQASWNVKPIIGAHVVALLFPTVQGGSFGGPI